MTKQSNFKNGIAKAEQFAQARIDGNYVEPPPKNPIIKPPYFVFSPIPAIGIKSPIEIIDGSESYYFNYFNRDNEKPNSVSFPEPYDENGNLKLETRQFILDSFIKWVKEIGDKYNSTEPSKIPRIRVFLILPNGEKYLGKEDGSISTIGDLQFGMTL